MSMNLKLGFFVTGLLGLALLSSSCATKQTAEALTESSSIQYQFAYDSYSRGELIPALTFILKAKELSPNNPDVHNLKGLIYFRQQKYGEAEESFAKAIELDPHGAQTHVNLGALYYEQKKYPEAMKSFDKALENPLYLNPERIHNNRGLALEAMGKTNDAAAEYRRAIELDRKFYLPYQNLGRLLFDKKDFASAKPLLEQAAKQCPECSEPRFYLGSLLLKENKASEALRLFKEGADTDPMGYYGQLCKKFVAPH